MTTVNQKTAAEEGERAWKNCTTGCVVAVVLIILTAYLCSLEAPRDEARRTKPASGVTLAQYQRVRYGMTLAEVERILGKGRLLDERLSSGVIYGWDGAEPGDCALIGFESGRVTVKTQTGLR